MYSKLGGASKLKEFLQELLVLQDALVVLAIESLVIGILPASGQAGLEATPVHGSISIAVLNILDGVPVIAAVSVVLGGVLPYAVANVSLDVGVGDVVRNGAVDLGAVGVADVDEELRKVVCGVGLVWRGHHDLVILPKVEVGQQPEVGLVAPLLFPDSRTGDQRDALCITTGEELELCRGPTVRGSNRHPRLDVLVLPLLARLRHDVVRPEPAHGVADPQHLLPSLLVQLLRHVHGGVDVAVRVADRRVPEVVGRRDDVLGAGVPLVDECFDHVVEVRTVARLNRHVQVFDAADVAITRDASLHTGGIAKSSSVRIVDELNVLAPALNGTGD
mmetsp:Transcript_10437/g.20735  ORF Transcript_10437/g.20735 Transcript_10437/m.20735 type:complete len:333 (-) Transcript_10437:221-1219(-)